LKEFQEALNQYNHGILGRDYISHIIL